MGFEKDVREENVFRWYAHGVIIDQAKVVKKVWRVEEAHGRLRE